MHYYRLLLIWPIHKFGSHNEVPIENKWKIWVGIKVFTCVVSINPTTISKEKISFSSQFQDFHNPKIYFYTLPYHAKVYDFGMVKFVRLIFLFCFFSVLVGAVGNKSHVCLLQPRLHRHVIIRFRTCLLRLKVVDKVFFFF